MGTNFRFRGAIYTVQQREVLRRFLRSEGRPISSRGFDGRTRTSLRKRGLVIVDYDDTFILTAKGRELLLDLVVSNHAP